MPRSWIVVRARFEATHCYPQAPEGVEFLRHPHRHEFHVKARMEVYHHDRELEFILVKRFLESVLPSGDLGAKSCEMIAHDLYLHLAKKYGRRRLEIEVSEDGENSAILEVGT